jgi:hypothetical protein
MWVICGVREKALGIIVEAAHWLGVLHCWHGSARGRGKCSRWKVIGEGEQAYRYFTLIGFCLFLVFAS